MKHADADTFERLSDVLVALRAMPGLREPRTGTFYRSGRAFVHFHDDPTGLFADVRLEPDSAFVRVPVTTVAQRRTFLASVRTSLAEPASRRSARVPHE
jgi:hypothetical protein